MQYLVSVIDDTAALATPAERAAIDAFNDRLTDGPSAESKEHLAGFWVLEAADLDVALELAAQGSKACNRKVEVRPFR